MTRPAWRYLLVALALWSTNGLFGALLSHLPALLVTGIALSIAGLLSLPGWRSCRLPLTTWVVGVGGIWGYHVLFLSAFHHAPAVEVNLVNYLWPLLTVLLSPALLPGWRLRWWHAVGALVGFAGAALIITNGHAALQWDHGKGYLLAASAAMVWACYSLLTKRVAPFPSIAVGGFCFLSGMLSFALLLATQGTHVVHFLPPQREWGLLLLQGCGPLGAAFLAWDAAIKHGDPRILGCLANLLPMTSTLVLVGLGKQSLTGIAAVGMVLLMGAAFVGSLDSFLHPHRERRPAKQPHWL